VIDAGLRLQPRRRRDEIAGRVLVRDGSRAGLQPTATEVIHEDDDLAERAEVFRAALVQHRRSRGGEAVATREEGHRGMRTWGGRLERPILGLRNLSKARGWEKQQGNDPEDPATNSIHTTSISMAFAGDCRTVQRVMCGTFVFHYSLALRNASHAARCVA
jgi:hypothetical protein